MTEASPACLDQVVIKFADNILKTLVRLKPASAKGTYVRGVAVSTTMGPGIRIDANEATRLASEHR